MSRTLPSSPDLRFLQKEAKDLLKAHKLGDARVCPTLRLLHRFEKAADPEILGAEVALHEVQFALAQEYGFASWPKLRAHVEAAMAGVADGASVVFRDERAARVGFQADRLKQDTFSLAVASALELLGKPIDYSTVFLWSCNAFGPDIRPEEPTRGHWQLQGRDRCVDVVAAGAGVQVRPFPDYHELADIPPRPGDGKEAEAWLREYYSKPAASYLSHALQAGEVVVSCGEWAGAHGLLWCDWGLVVEARSDGTILGAGPNRRGDNLITHIRDGWVLRPGGSSVSGEELHRRILRRAVQRVRGEGAAYVPGPRKVLFGLPAMDAWIDAMAQVPFDQEQWQGEDHSAAHARQTALPTFEGSKAAATHLRGMARLLPRAAEPLQNAAGQYDRIVELLRPALDETGLHSYSSIMGDPLQQRTHVEETLRPVRECLNAAAQFMGKATATS